MRKLFSQLKMLTTGYSNPLGLSNPNTQVANEIPSQEGVLYVEDKGWRSIKE
jgi:hypothetical protein